MDSAWLSLAAAAAVGNYCHFQLWLGLIGQFICTLLQVNSSSHIPQKNLRGFLMRDI